MITQNQSQITGNTQELTAEEIDQVGGAGTVKGVAAIGAAAGIGAAAFGSTWGAMAVGAAFAAAPIAVVGMGVLVAYGTYKFIRG